MRPLSISSGRWFGVALTLVAGALSWSADRVRIEPFKTIRSGPAVAESTDVFRPQINLTRTTLEMRPENPVNMSWMSLPAPRNRLKAGGVSLSTSFQISRFFPAIDATGWTPPDPTLAVGPRHIIATVNSAVAFFDKETGEKQFQQNLNGAGGFFGAVGATDFVFDPKCLYDQIANRFVVISPELSSGTTESKILLAVSDDDDPNGIWYKYRLEAKITDAAGAYWLDYPGFGYNKDGYAVCGNMFGFESGWAGVQFLVIPKVPVLKGDAVTVSYLRDPNAGSVQLSHSLDNGLDQIYGAAVWSGSALRVYAISNPASNPNLISTLVTVPNFTGTVGPGRGPNGHDVDALDGRLLNIVTAGGTLYTTHTTSVPTGDRRNQCRWYALNINGFPGNDPTLQQAGDVAGPEGDHYLMPAIGANPEGDVALVFTRISSTITADVMVSGRTLADAAGEMGEPLLLETSVASQYGGVGNNRWGDYFGCVVDPTDTTRFFSIGMVANSSGGWITVVHNFVLKRFAVQSLSFAEPSVGGGDSVTATVTIDQPAPPSGVTVRLSSSNSKVATVPKTVTVPSGATSVEFPVTSRQVMTSSKVTISARIGTSIQTAELTVVPGGLLSVSVDPIDIVGGQSGLGTVTIGRKAPAGGAVVTVAVDNKSVVSMNWKVVIPAGQRSATFQVNTKPVQAITPVRLWAAYPGPTLSCNIRVLPDPDVMSLSLGFASNQIRSNQSTMATVTLSKPAGAGGQVVQLKSSTSSLKVPASVTVAAGSTTAVVKVTAGRVRRPVNATVTATAGTSKGTATIAILP